MDYRWTYVHILSWFMIEKLFEGMIFICFIVFSDCVRIMSHEQDL